MEFFDVALRRRMTRRFDPSPIPDEALARLVAAGASAPTAGKTSGVELLVLKSPERRALFWDLASDRTWREDGQESAGVLAAPVIIVPVADPDAYVARYAPYWIVDASFAVMLMLLAAADASLGALFFQLHAPSQTVLAGLGLPATRVTIGALAVGHPAVSTPAD